MKHEEQINEICSILQTTKQQLLLPRRHRLTIENRHLVIKWYRDIARLTQTEIGAIFGKDHTTIIHSVKNANNLIKYESQIKDKWNSIRNIMPVAHYPRFTSLSYRSPLNIAHSPK